jgi:hypothetical protein
MRLSVACIGIAALLASRAPAPPQNDRPDPGVRALREVTDFLLGNWEGEGSGQPGASTGRFTFEVALDGHAVLRRSRADYPARGDAKAFSHQDLMVIYPESGQIRADAFDNEGHAIHYAVAFDHFTDTLTFVSPIVEGQPRYRLVYRPLAIDRVLVTFEIAPPGKPAEFVGYVKGASRKVQ